jgi:hypothetical protein
MTQSNYDFLGINFITDLLENLEEETILLAIKNNLLMISKSHDKTSIK